MEENGENEVFEEETLEIDAEGPVGAQTVTVIPPARDNEHVVAHVLIKKVTAWVKKEQKFSMSNANFGTVFLQIPKVSLVNTSFISEECLLKILIPELRRLLIAHKASGLIGGSLPQIFRIDFSRSMFMKRNARESGKRYTPTQGHELVSANGTEKVALHLVDTKNRNKPNFLQICMAGFEYGTFYSDEVLR